MGLVTKLKSALYQQPTIDLQTFLVNKGRAFSLSSRVNDLGNGESVFIHVDNPTGSGYDYDVVLLPRSTGRADIDISFGADSGDAGNEEPPQNLQSGSTRTFSGTAHISTSEDAGTLPTHGEMFIEDFVPGTGTGANIGAEVIDSVAFTIDEGGDKLLELRNESGGSVDRIGLNVILFEVDGTYKQHR